LRGLAALGAAGVALLGAGCGDDGEHACSECGPPRIAVADDTVWVAQGRSLLRLDPGTGEIERTTAVLPQRRSGDLGATDEEDGFAGLAAGRLAIVLDADGDEAGRATVRRRTLGVGVAFRGPRLLVAGGRRLWAVTGDRVSSCRSMRPPASTPARARR
jgi:hypothetical protein